jgi:choline-sulfatase
MLFILSDEHNRDVLGCYGDEIVDTPNLDALAARGTRFTDAYTNSPICVPARASLATGQYPHTVGCWDNAAPYDGKPQSWHHVLREAGHEVVSVGKLHFRSTDDDNGFSEEILPLHVVDGVGDLKSLLRRDPPQKGGLDKMAKEASEGVGEYASYDEAITAAAIKWIAERGSRTQKPWCLFVSLTMPHFPLIADPKFFSLYRERTLDEMQEGRNLPPSEHEFIREMRQRRDYDAYFTDAQRRTALQAYYGMVSHVDDMVGRLVDAVEAAGLTDATRVIYSSDHGDNLGNRGLWGKSVMYDDSAAIPMIAAGAGIPENAVNDTPVSLVDMFPTLLQAAGAPMEATQGVPGQSLFDIVTKPNRERAVFSEYHASGSPTGAFMLRKGRWKLVIYPGYVPQLFDMEADPGEAADLGTDPAHAEVRTALLDELRKIAEPDEVNARAFADQEERIRINGGRESILGTADIPHTPAPAL